MKRENDENIQETDAFYQQQMVSNNGEQSVNFEETNNATDTISNNGPTNPAKRQRRSDDEEIRLLIPSKVRKLVKNF